MIVIVTGWKKPSGFQVEFGKCVMEGLRWNGNVLELCLENVGDSYQVRTAGDYNKMEENFIYMYLQFYQGVTENYKLGSFITGTLLSRAIFLNFKRFREKIWLQDLVRLGRELILLIREVTGFQLDKGVLPERKF